MAYVDVADVALGDLIDETMFNQILANIRALYNRAYVANRLDISPDKTTTSATFVDVDATNLKLLITLDAPANVLVGFTGAVSLSVSGLNHFDITVDGVRQGLDDGIYGERNNNNVAPGNNVSFTYLLTNLAAGVHDIRLQWKVSTGTATMYAGAGTATADIHPQFWAQQV